MTKRIKLLGSLDIELNGQHSEILKSDKGCALLTYLIVTKKVQSRQKIADLLWDAESTASSLHNLRQLLSSVRKWVPDWFRIDRKQIAFQIDDTVFVDFYELDEALMSDDGDKLDKGLQLYEGDLLADFYLKDGPVFNEWLDLARQQLKQQVLERYRKLCYIYAEQKEWIKGIVVARRWLSLEKLEEDAHYCLMWFLASNGQIRAALVQYQKCCQCLADELDIEPTEKTVLLYKNIRNGTFSKCNETQRVKPTKGMLPLPHIALPYDWGEAPINTVFFGRKQELNQLEQWLIMEHCHVVTVLGMGGQGKTSLAAMSARFLAKHFKGIFWRSLHNAPPLKVILHDCFHYVSDHQFTTLPDTIETQLSMLLDYLRRGAFLLILDNMESILQSKQVGQFRKNYEDYSLLLNMLVTSNHQSCMIVISREHPQELIRLKQDYDKVRFLQLQGLEEKAVTSLFQTAGLCTSQKEITLMVSRYSGNPLALKQVVQTIKEFYLCDVADFLGDETPVFEEIRDVLDQQFARLSSLEQEILLWLAVERRAMTPKDLTNDLLHMPRQRVLLEALRSLQRRSLLQNTRQGFALQNVITEYLTDYLINQISQEILMEKLNLMNHLTLQQTQAMEYVRQSQERLILRPIAKQLTTEKCLSDLDKIFRRLLNQLRSEGPSTPGYGAGNILNLLLHMGIDVTGYDFSQLSVWQAFLQGVNLPWVNFTEADLSHSVFYDIFGFFYSVAISSDGNFLAAGTSNGRILLWRTVTQELFLTLHGHSEAVWSVAFCPDAKIMASGSSDRTVRIWDITTGEVLRILKGHSGGVQAVAFSPDGQTLVSAGEDRRICLWDVHTGKRCCILEGHTSNVQTAAFSPDGKTLVSGSRDQTVRLWNISLSEPREIEQTCQILRGHSNWVNSVSFSPDGQTLVSGSEDCTVRFWDAYTGQALRIFQKHSAGVRSVAFSPDGKTLASSSNDHTVQLWDARTGRTHHILQGHSNWVYSVALSPDGQTLASGSWDHTVRLWNTRNGQEIRTLRGYTNWVFCVAFSPDGRTLASGTSDKRVRLWDVQTSKVIHILQGHTEWVWSSTFCPDSTLLASASMDNTVWLWNTCTGQSLHTLRAHNDGVKGVAFSPDGQILASGGLDHIILLWDLSNRETIESNKPWKTLINPSGWCLDIVFSPDGQILASCGSDHKIQLWDISTGQIQKTLSGHCDGVQQIAFSPDGTFLASASWDRIVIVWDVASGHIRHALEGHTNIVRSVAFSPDVQILASGGNDKTVRLWNVHTGKTHRILHGHTNWIFSVAFSPDGQTLASSSADETIKLWNPYTGELRKTLRMSGPYEGMNIARVKGLSDAQKATLEMLGAER